ncbi:hypothetical protein KSP9073_02571 [Kushneria phyllosphaerae]|uniref:Uncharacterized protein n=1 Tax=Kushneria phyllosphaerae TaxID=2100822 RepID=A0A2R8CNR6_9GAMM|nr:hypothetical protein KSP9073_02571 [Kushneria phyllosphaerae]
MSCMAVIALDHNHACYWTCCRRTSQTDMLRTTASAKAEVLNSVASDMT